MNRRNFMTSAALAATSAAAISSFPWQTSPTAQATEPTPSPAGPFDPLVLPYADDALEPVISARAIGFHFGKHHQGYLTNLVRLIKDKPYESMTLEEVVRTSWENKEDAAIFNNAAQVWNHSFYWQSMKPEGGGEPSGALVEAINQSFGSFEAFQKAFTAAALTQFGSGWAWLVLEGDKLAVSKTGNAETPLAHDASHGIKPLLTIDVWEHAYYLDYQNRRADYIANWLDKLVNWDFAASNMA